MHNPMIRNSSRAKRNGPLALLLASAVSIVFHLASWLGWQTAPTKPALIETPPQVIEVALTAPPAVKPLPVITPNLETPVQPPKQNIIKPKPKLTPKPIYKPKSIIKPTLPTLPTKPLMTQTAPEHLSNPIVTTPSKVTTKSTQPTTPVQEPLVKAIYSSPSLKNPPTHYPRIAQMRQWEGTVVLEIRVLANGSAGDVKIAHSSGHEILDDSAVEQVKSWRFTPAHKGEKTVDDWIRVPIIFKFKH